MNEYDATQLWVPYHPWDMDSMPPLLVGLEIVYEETRTQDMCISYGYAERGENGMPMFYTTDMKQIGDGYRVVSYRVMTGTRVLKGGNA